MLFAARVASATEPELRVEWRGHLRSLRIDAPGNHRRVYLCEVASASRLLWENDCWAPAGWHQGRGRYDVSALPGKDRRAAVALAGDEIGVHVTVDERTLAVVRVLPPPPRVLLARASLPTNQASARYVITNGARKTLHPAEGGSGFRGVLDRLVDGRWLPARRARAIGGTDKPHLEPGQATFVDEGLTKDDALQVLTPGRYRFSVDVTDEDPARATTRYRLLEEFTIE